MLYFCTSYFIIHPKNKIMNPKLGITNLKVLVLFICTFTLAMRDFAHRSKFGIMLTLVPLFSQVQNLCRNLANVKAELADLDAQELAILAEIVMEKMNISTAEKAKNFILNKISFIHQFIDAEDGEDAQY
jgi:hypothetical protein